SPWNRYSERPLASVRYVPSPSFCRTSSETAVSAGPGAASDAGGTGCASPVAVSSGGWGSQAATIASRNAATVHAAGVIFRITLLLPLRGASDARATIPQAQEACEGGGRPTREPSPERPAVQLRPRDGVSPPSSVTTSATTQPSRDGRGVIKTRSEGIPTSVLCQGKEYLSWTVPFSEIRTMGGSELAAPSMLPSPRAHSDDRTPGTGVVETGDPSGRYRTTRPFPKSITSRSPSGARAAPIGFLSSPGPAPSRPAIQARVPLRRSNATTRWAWKSMA